MEKMLTGHVNGFLQATSDGDLEAEAPGGINKQVWNRQAEPSGTGQTVWHELGEIELRNCVFPRHLDGFHAIPTRELYFGKQSSNLYWLSVMHRYVTASRYLYGSRQRWPKFLVVLCPPPLPALLVRKSQHLEGVWWFPHHNSRLCRQPSASALRNNLTTHNSPVLFL